MYRGYFKFTTLILLSYNLGGEGLFGGKLIEEFDSTKNENEDLDV